MNVPLLARRVTELNRAAPGIESYGYRRLPADAESGMVSEPGIVAAHVERLPSASLAALHGEVGVGPALRVRVIASSPGVAVRAGIAEGPFKQGLDAAGPCSSCRGRDLIFPPIGAVAGVVHAQAVKIAAIARRDRRGAVRNL